MVNQINSSYFTLLKLNCLNDSVFATCHVLKRFDVVCPLTVTVVTRKSFVFAGKVIQ